MVDRRIDFNVFRIKRANIKTGMMREFFQVRKILKPTFESMVSVNDFVFFIQNYYSIPELPKKIELFHANYYISFY